MKKAKPTTWRPNSTLKASEKPIARKVAPKKVNRARMKKRNTEAFGGGKAEFVRSLPCVVDQYARNQAWSACDGAIEAAHERSRGAGGTAANLVALCRRHHAEQHSLGRSTFESKYGLHLGIAADLYEALYQAFNPDNVSGEQ